MTVIVRRRFVFPGAAVSMKIASGVLREWMSDFPNPLFKKRDTKNVWDLLRIGTATKAEHRR